MRPTLIAGSIIAALLVAGAAIAAEATMTSTPVTSTADTDPVAEPVADAYEDRLERRERRSERLAERRGQIVAFARDVAEELGLETEEVLDAVAVVLSDRLDAAVAAGTIGPQRAEQLQGDLTSGEEDAIRAAVRALFRATLADRGLDLDDAV